MPRKNDDDDPDVDYTESGHPVYRHKARNDDLELAVGDEEAIEAVTAHIEEYVGPMASVFHEIVSDKVYLDVHIVEPTKKRPFYTLATSGLNDKKMHVPEGQDASKYAELCICLPDHW